MEVGSASRLIWSRESNTTIRGDRSVPVGSLTLTRKGLTATVVGSKIYTVGGGIGSGVESLRVLDIEANLWQVVPLPLGVARKNHVAFLWNEFLYVYSGTRSETILTDMFRIDISNAMETDFIHCYWQNLSPFAVKGLAGSFCEASNEFVVTGGVLADENISPAFCFCFSAHTHTFYEPVFKGRVPPTRVSHASCSVNNKVFIHGGWGPLGPYWHNDIHVLTIVGSTYTWSQLDHGTGLSTTSATMSFSCDKLMVVGDTFTMNATGLRVFSLKERKWLEVKENVGTEEGGEDGDGDGDVQVVNETRRNGEHAVVTTGNKLILLGGYSIKGWEYSVLEAFKR